LSRVRVGMLPTSGVPALTIAFEYIVLLKIAALLLCVARLGLRFHCIWVRWLVAGVCVAGKNWVFDTIVPHVPLLTLLLSRPISDAPMVTCSCALCFLQMATEVRPSVRVCSQFAGEGVGIWGDDAHFCPPPQATTYPAPSCLCPLPSLLAHSRHPHLLPWVSWLLSCAPTPLKPTPWRPSKPHPSPRLVPQTSLATRACRATAPCHPIYSPINSPAPVFRAAYILLLVLLVVMGGRGVGLGVQVWELPADHRGGRGGQLGRSLRPHCLAERQPRWVGSQSKRGEMKRSL
jgi:hypothetical protein